MAPRPASALSAGEMVTRWPQPCSSILGTRPRISRYEERRLMFIIRSQRAGGVSRKGVWTRGAAFLTRLATEPRRGRVFQLWQARDFSSLYPIGLARALRPR